MQDEMYKENLLDHYQNPRNCEEMSACSFQMVDHNPVCGDQIHIFAKIGAGRKAGRKAASKISKMTFKGSGCAISQAATSMLSEKVKGKTINQILKLDQQEVQKMLGIDVGVARMKCAMLGLRTLQKGLAQYLAAESSTN